MTGPDRRVDEGPHHGRVAVMVRQRALGLLRVLAARAAGGADHFALIDVADPAWTATRGEVLALLGRI